MRFGSTFYRMPEGGRSPLGLGVQSCLLILLPPELLYAQVVFMYGDTQHHLGTLLIDNELVQVLPEGLGRDVTASDVGGATQRAPCWLISLVEAREALAAKVRAVVSRVQGASGVECAAADGA